MFLSTKQMYKNQVKLTHMSWFTDFGLRLILQGQDFLKRYSKHISSIDSYCYPFAQF